MGFGDQSERLLDYLRVNGRIVSGQCLPMEEINALRRAKEAGLIIHDESARAYYPANVGTALRQVQTGQLQEYGAAISVGILTIVGLYLWFL